MNAPPLPAAGTPQRLHGLPIVTSLMMTEAGEPVQVARTLRERWLSRPWRPWPRFKTVTPQVPSKTVYRTPTSIIMHPARLAELRVMLQARKESQNEF